MSNQHVSDFLDYYCSKDIKNPQYAVLLKGNWGSGKTYFIKKYKKELKDKKIKHIYVSLYGATSYDEIETKFLQSTNPTIFNNKTIFAGKLADAFIDNKIKNSLGVIRKSLTSLNAKGNILIFDDLERCSMKIPDLLGFINSFVEHQSYKVIVIANEKELEKTEKYFQIKEKLIGKTFEITSNKEEAYNFFLEELNNEKNVIEKIFNEYKYLVLDTYEDSEYKNLRVLRQSILDFERIYNEFLHEYDNKELLIDFMRIYFIFYFEINVNNYTVEDYLIDQRNTYSNAMNSVFNESINEESKKIKIEMISSKYEIFKQKYKIEYDENRLILSANSWTDILINSKIDKEQYQKEIKWSEYFIDENTPNWKRLAKYYYKLDDKKFEELVNKVYDDFLVKYCEKYEQYMLISSNLLFFYDNKIFKFKDKPYDKILKGFELVYSKNKENLKKRIFNELNYMERNDRSYENIGYLSDTISFKKLDNYINGFFEGEKTKVMKEDSKLIIKLLKQNNGQKLLEVFEGRNDDIVLYHNKPILNYIDFDDFYKVLINTDGDTMYYFGGIIKDRYCQSKENLFVEKKFLEELLSKVNEYIAKNEYKLSTYNLKKEVKSNLEIAIDNINKLSNISTKE